MSESVEVPFEGKAGDKAVLLLAAAEELGLPAGVVRTGLGKFIVPQDVHDKAFGDRPKEKSTDSETDSAPAKKAPAKKTAAKKTTTTKAQE